MPSYKGDKGSGKGKKGSQGMNSDNWRDSHSYWSSNSARYNQDQVPSSRGKGRPRGDTPPKSDDSGHTDDTRDTVNNSMLDDRMRKMQEDFMKAITTMSDKNSEKFNLIFGILNELQTRQAKLMDDVKGLEAQMSDVQSQQQQPWDTQGCANMGQIVWVQGQEQNGMWQG
mmetsp:Transcript_46353/g.107928  ORF Transcript_46353/g.107928 Transcript_46353/m.107928 type:complete len:170 (+) Transcript_46353:101-610(+)